MAVIPDPSLAQPRRGRFVSTPSSAARRFWRVNRTYWLTVLYCGGWALVRAEGFGLYTPLPLRSRFAIGLVFLVAVASLTLRTRVAIRRGGYGRSHPSRIGWLFTILDLSALTAAIRLTGGIDSGLWPILFVIVVAETVLEPTREAWFVRMGAALALTVACVPFPLRFGPYLIELATRLVFLLGVTSVARRLREGSDHEKGEISALRAELALTEERSHLAREVHDGVGNSLAAAVLRLEVAAREQEIGRTSEPVPVLLREEAKALRQAMNAVRDWTYWTRPWALAGLAFETDSANGERSVSGAFRLTEEVERLSRRTGLPIRLSGADLLDEPSMAGQAATALRLTIFRIAQEALTNTAKHATGSTGADVDLRREGGFLTLSIRDDGPGIPTDKATNCGVGLSSMRERAEGAGGTLTIDSGDEGRGVTVTARLPLP